MLGCFSLIDMCYPWQLKNIRTKTIIDYLSLYSVSYEKMNCVISLSSWCDWTNQKVSMLLTNTLNKQVIMVRYIAPLTKQKKTEEIITVKQGNRREQIMTTY